MMKIFKINRHIKYLTLLLIFLYGFLQSQPSLGLTSASNTGEADASSKAFSEGDDGIIYLKIQNITYDYNTKVYLNVENTLGQWGTAMLWDNMTGQGHNDAQRDDYNNITYVNTGLTQQWQLSIEQTVLVADGAIQYFPVRINVIDDLRYEPGTPETINLSLTAISAGGSLTGGLNEFVYQITDNDEKPKYEFVETEVQTVGENSFINNAGKVQAVAHSDGNVYVVGTNSFTIDYVITNGTTSDSDHRADASWPAGDKTGTIVLYEWDYNSNGSVADGGGHNLDHYMTDDVLDEPNETFSITISSSDSDDGLIGTNTELDFIVTDHVDDLPPFIQFRDASVTISENGSPQVSVVAQLHQASGFDSVSCGYSIDGNATHTGARADHDLGAGELKFGLAGDTEQSIIFNLVDDNWDEGADGSVFEEIIITFLASQASNVQVDEGGANYRDSFTFKIQDDDSAPTMSFSNDVTISDNEDSESTQTPTINVVLNALSELEIKATYSQNTDGTATLYTNDDNPWDFKFDGDGTITIAPFAQIGVIPVTINSDETFDEENETVIINVTSGQNVGGGTFSHTYTIIDDDDTPTLYFSNHTTQISSVEDGSSNRTDGSIEVRLSAPSGRQVDYTISVDTYDGNGYKTDGIDNDGDGVEGEDGEGFATSSDFILNASSGSIAAYGEGKSSTITYTHFGDNTDELDKYIKLLVGLGSSNRNATVASDNSKYQIIKLQDDDDPISLSINQNIFAGTEGQGPYDITVSKPADKNTEFTVKTTISIANATATDGDVDDDFDLSYEGTPIASGASQILTMGPDVNSASIVLAIDNDNLYETSTDEEIQFSIGNFVNSAIGTGTLTFSIADNEDAPTIEFDTDASKSVPSGEESTTQPLFTVKTSHRSILPAVVNASVTNPSTFLTSDDYILNDAIITIPAGETSIPVDLRIVNDSRYEEAETFTITLSDASDAHTTIGSALTHNYQINANDDKPTLYFVESNTNDKSEDDGSLSIIVTLSAISGINSSVDYSFTGSVDHTGANADYTDITSGSGTLTWTGNVDQQKSITLNFTDDKIDELKENIVISLSNITGGATTGPTMTHTITLGDSDPPPPLGLDITGDASTNAVTQNEGDTFIPKIVVKDGFSSDFPISIVWSIDNNGTTAIIYGEDNEDFKIADKNGTLLAGYSSLSASDRTVVLPANTQSMNLLQILTPTDDLWELSEQFVFRIATPTSQSGYDNGGNLVSVDGSIDNGQNIKTITVNNAASETIPKVSITSSNSGPEAETTTEFTVSLSANGSGASKSGFPIYVAYATGSSPINASDIAEEGASSDFVLPSDNGVIEIPAYSSSINKSISLKDDLMYEYDEDIVINLSLYSGGSDSAAVVDADNSTYVYTIVDNESPPVLEFEDADNAISYDESNDLARIIYVQFKSSGTQLAEMPVTAYLTVDDGGSSAANGIDFGSDDTPAPFATDFEVTIPAKSSDRKAGFNFYAIADNRYEVAQTAVFSLNTYTQAELPAGKSNQSNATSSSSEKMTVTINENPDEIPIAQWVDNTGNSGNVPYPLSTGERYIDEDSGPGYFTLQLATFSEREVTINYSLVENESVSDPPNIVATGGTSATYPVDYRYWSSGTDGVGSSSEFNTATKTGSITFSPIANNVSNAANRQYVNIEIPLNADNINEWNESISLQTTSGNIDKLIINDDDDPPKVKFTELASGNDVNEQILSSSPPTFEVAIYDQDGVTGISTGKDIYLSVITNDASDNYAIADPGIDFIALADTESDWIKIPASTTIDAQSQIFTLSIIDDLIDEENQTVTMTLAVKGSDFNGQKNFSSSARGFDERASDAAILIDASKTHVYTIKDDDPTPVAYFFEENSDVSTTADTETQYLEEKYDEGSIPGTKTIKVKTEGDSEKIITLYYAAVTSDDDCPSQGNCASPGNDYDQFSSPATLTISPTSNNEATFTVITKDDNRDEYDQDIIIQLSVDGSSNATISSASNKPGRYRLVIQDQDPTPDVDFLLGDRNQAESTNSGSSTVKLSTSTEKNVRIGYEVSSNESDFDIFTVNEELDDNGIIEWPEDIDMKFGLSFVDITGLTDEENNTTMSANIPTLVGTDDIDEWDEKFKIAIDVATSENVNKGSINPMTIITIQDDDLPQEVEFSSSSQSNDESDNNYLLEISIPEISGKDIAVKYSISRNDNPNNKDYASKGVDYSFGPSVQTNANGDSIVIIRSQSLTANIPLTIIEDEIIEEDQLIKIKISLSNSYADDPNDDYYNSLSGNPGVDATLGDESLFTYTIIDDEELPIVHMINDVSAAEIGLLNDFNAAVSLKDSGGNLVTSEKTVSVSYMFDSDNSTASIESNDPLDQNKYSEDFNLINGDLEFTPTTYAYDTNTDSYTSISGENSKNINYTIYGDDLYELDETITIKLPNTSFVNASSSGGDHSFVHTILNDDSRPSPYWETSYQVGEVDENGDISAARYTYSNVKIKIDEPSGTDMFIIYSMKELGDDDPSEPANVNVDFELPEDDLDLNQIGKKSLTILAATSDGSDLSKTIDIDIINDDSVEPDEKFILQIDSFQDINFDGTLADNAQNSTEETSILIKDNDNYPVAEAPTEILTSASDIDRLNVAPNHWDPITPGYWNKYNTGLTIKVPITDTYTSLENGRIRLQAAILTDNGIISSAYDFQNVERTITKEDIENQYYIFILNAEDFEGADENSRPPWFAEGNTVYFRSVIYDKYSPANVSFSPYSATTIKIDEIKPSSSNYIVESVIPKSGNEVLNFLNGTNETALITITVQDKDITVDNGSILLFGGIGDDKFNAIYDTLGTALRLTSSDNEIGKTVTFSIDTSEINLLDNFGQDRYLNFKIEVADEAGNKSDSIFATEQLLIDTVEPKIVSVKSVTKEDYDVIKNGLFAIDDSIYIKLEFSENIFISEGDASIVLDVASQALISNSSLQDVSSVVAIYKVLEGESTSTLSFENLNILSPGAKLRDNAGNIMIAFSKNDLLESNRLTNTSSVEIDGEYPANFTIEKVFVKGSNNSEGYWNSTSSELIVRVGDYASSFNNDQSLIDGTVQLKIRIYSNSNTTPSTGWRDLGAPISINDQTTEPDGPWVESGSPSSYDQLPTKAIHFPVDGSILEAIAGFPDTLASPEPQQSILIDFNAMVMDKAGNEKLGATSQTAQLLVDQVKPLDPKTAFSDSYNYDFPSGIEFDNYLDVKPEYDATGIGFSRTGYYNSTNNGITFKSWLGFDDNLNTTVTVDRDQSLIGGNVQVMYSSVASNVPSNWLTLGAPVTITQNDINSNDTAFVSIFISDTDLTANAELFKENNTIYFKNVITDVAGNSIVQDGFSSFTIFVDETPQSKADLTYSRKYVNGVDHSPIVTIEFDLLDPPGSIPELSATFADVSGTEPVNELMSASLNPHIFTYVLDVPGARGNPNYDDVVTITINTTDIAGNPLPTEIVTGKTDLIIDNTPPIVEFKYANVTNDAAILANVNMGKTGDSIVVKAILSEQMYYSDDIISDNRPTLPTLSVDSTNAQDLTDIIVVSADEGAKYIVDATGGVEDTVEFKFQIPSGNGIDGEELDLKLFLGGTDWAGNPVDSVEGYLPISGTQEPSQTAFSIDNVLPSFDNFNLSDGQFINSTILGWENFEEIMLEAFVEFERQEPDSPPVPLIEGDSISLTNFELNRAAHGPYFINNNDLLLSALSDSGLYDVTFYGKDRVGNNGQYTINNITYDTKAPTVKIEFTNEFITGLDDGSGTTIRVTFSEAQKGIPSIRLFYGGIAAQNTYDGASWTIDENILQQAYIDTFNVELKEGPIDLTPTSDNLIWEYEIEDGSLLENTQQLQWDGFVWVKVISKDKAGNEFVNDNLVKENFINTLYYDNTEPTATFTYTNLRDPLLTSYNATNADESYCCFAIYGDTVLIKMEMNEKIKDRPSEPPTLTFVYNSGSGIIADTLKGIEATPHPDDIKYSDEQTAEILHFKIVIADGEKNNGVLELQLNAEDRSNTKISNYGYSSQKPVNSIESRFALEIDNIHPWGNEENPIFSEVQNIVTFPTEKFSSSGFRVIENWINKQTDSLYVGVIYEKLSSDSTMININQNWGPQGRVGMEVKNIEGSDVWVTLGDPAKDDTLKVGAETFGDYAYSTIISRSVEDLVQSGVLNDGSSSNALLFRAYLKDKNGNVTNGQPSDKYSPNSEDLYVEDIFNMDTVRYDIIAPEIGAFNGGNFDAPGGSEIISNDTITISWSEFEDQGGASASGVDLYELQVYVYDSTQTFSSAADTLARIDSLFTVDLNQDGVDDEEYWYKIYKEQAPSINNTITLNMLDSLVTDSISNAIIDYDYNAMLKHKFYYMIFLRAFDVAGNASDTLYSEAIRRINSAPILSENNDGFILYEDISWDYDTIKVEDLDLYTLQNDSFTFSLEPKKITVDAVGVAETLDVIINPPQVDPITGLISWTPIQDSIPAVGDVNYIDQSGEYILTFFVEDLYGFKDTINISATVNAVNDTPVVAILGEDNVITWREDKPENEEIKINLSNYVSDIDNPDSELAWQFVIMDTSQLDEDFPLASVIVGPGTPKALQTKLMKQYMGFNPSKGLDMPTLAEASGNSTLRMISAANSLISIDIDTSTDENTYAIFTSDSNYHGSNHRIIFSAIDPFGASDQDTIIVNIIPENDPPIVATIDTIVINENDSIWIDFSQYTTDVDDTTLTFKIEGLFNTDSINFDNEPYISDGVGDTVLFDPFDLWSGSANFKVTASDEEAQSSQLFTLKVLRVPRPDIEVSLVQNNAFSSYVSIIVIDKEQKTKYLQLEVQNQRIAIDTIASYTYTGDFSFGIGGGYSFDVLAVAEVGRTIYTNTFNLAPARVSNRWYANSSDGTFHVAGDAGSVDIDQNILIVDSTLFISNFTDKASYVLGDETYLFNKPIEVHFRSIRQDLSIYQRENGIIWKELPSINKDGQIFTRTDNAGYFRLGPKTIIVPENTDLHQNFPNPFNPVTNIKYDIGLLDGLEQKVSVNIYNVAGQHITTLINNVSQVGQFNVIWDGIDKYGKILPSGIYFVQLRTDSGIIKNKKMMFIK